MGILCVSQVIIHGVIEMRLSMFYLNENNNKNEKTKQELTSTRNNRKRNREEYPFWLNLFAVLCIKQIHIVWLWMHTHTHKLKHSRRKPRQNVNKLKSYNFWRHRTSNEQKREKKDSGKTTITNHSSKQFHVYFHLFFSSFLSFHPIGMYNCVYNANMRGL